MLAAIITTARTTSGVSMLVNVGSVRIREYGKMNVYNSILTHIRVGFWTYTIVEKDNKYTIPL